MIVSGSASQSLAAELAGELGEELAELDVRRFPDGELLAGVPGFDADRAVVVASTVSAEAHLELLQLQDAVRAAGADRVTTVVPYMGYARQDRAADPEAAPGEAGRPGYPASARAVARAISTGADRVLTVTPHERAVCEYFDPPAVAVDAAPRLAAPLPADLTEPLFLAPDGGAVDIARSVRSAYGRGAVEAFAKTRLSGSEVEVRVADGNGGPGDGDGGDGGTVAVDGRDVVLVDDIVATGSTMSESVGLLADRDVGRVYVACVHPLLVGGARTRLHRAGAEAVVGTDTVERTVSAVSVAPAVADHL